MLGTGSHTVEENVRVDKAAIVGGQRVTARPLDDQSGFAQRPPGAVHKNLQVGGRVGGRPSSPEGLSEHVVGDELSPAGGQHTKEGAHETAPEDARRNLLTGAPRRETSEHPKFHDHRATSGPHAARSLPDCNLTR